MSSPPLSANFVFWVLDGGHRPIRGGVPNLHELYIMMLEDSCVHTLLFARAHFYDKPKELLLGAISRSSQT